MRYDFHNKGHRGYHHLKGQITLNVDQTPQGTDINPVLATLILFGVLGIVLSLLLAQRPEIDVPESTEVVEVVEVVPTATIPPEPEVVGYHPDVVADGQQLYSGSCTGCHGGDARGIPGIGKDLVESDFMDGLSDEELVQFIIEGRGPFDEGNTTGIMMPALGGNPSLDDEDVLAIVSYLRTLAGAPIAEDATAPTVETVEVPDVDETTDEDTTDTNNTDDVEQVEDTTAYEPVIFTPIDLFSSAEAYGWSCAGCHGADGTGVEGIADSILDSDLITEANQEALFAYLTTPQAVGSTDEFIHPINGESPALSDAELSAVIEYVQDLVPVEFDAESAYNWSCAGCHGIDGQGVDGLGEAIVSADNAEDIFALLTTITPIVSAEAGFVHPVYGGYPILNDEEIQAVVDYMLTLDD